MQVAEPVEISLKEVGEIPISCLKEQPAEFDERVVILGCPAVVGV